MLKLIVLVAYYCNFNGCSKTEVDGVTHIYLCDDVQETRQLDTILPEGRLVVTIGNCQET